MLIEQQISERRERAKSAIARILTRPDGQPFGDYQIKSTTGKTYRVALRGSGLFENFCSCPDFAVNTLGTCKHIEFTLAKLHRRPGAKAAFRAGFHPEYSEIYVRYGAQRQVMFRPGSDCPSEFLKHAREFFDAEGRLVLADALWYARREGATHVLDIATLTGAVGPFGFTVSGSREDTVTGFGDLAPMFNVRWNAGVHNFMTYITGNLTTGRYDPTRLANLGIGHNAIDAGGAVRASAVMICAKPSRAARHSAQSARWASTRARSGASSSPRR